MFTQTKKSPWHTYNYKILIMHPPTHTHTHIWAHLYMEFRGIWSLWQDLHEVESYYILVLVITLHLDLGAWSFARGAIGLNHRGITSVPHIQKLIYWKNTKNCRILTKFPPVAHSKSSDIWSCCICGMQGK